MSLYTEKLTPPLIPSSILASSSFTVSSPSVACVCFNAQSSGSPPRFFKARLPPVRRIFPARVEFMRRHPNLPTHRLSLSPGNSRNTSSISAFRLRRSGNAVSCSRSLDISISQAFLTPSRYPKRLSKEIGGSRNESTVKTIVSTYR